RQGVFPAACRSGRRRGGGLPAFGSSIPSNGLKLTSGRLGGQSESRLSSTATSVDCGVREFASRLEGGKLVRQSTDSCLAGPDAPELWMRPHLERCSESTAGALVRQIPSS